MPATVRVEPVSPQQLEALLPMIASYQCFYEVAQIDDERNRAFFSRFLAPSDDGMLLGAWRGDELAGYACLFWHFTSLVPAETVLMNDLYVAEIHRGEGIGRALIEASAEVARERKAHSASSGPPSLRTGPPNVSTTRLAPSAASGSSTSYSSGRRGRKRSRMVINRGRTRP